MSVAEIASKFKVSAIVVYTESGSTAKRVSRYRPESMIIAATPNEPVTRSLALNWGVKGVVCQPMHDRAAQLEYAQVLAKENLFNQKILCLIVITNIENKFFPMNNKILHYNLKF